MNLFTADLKTKVTSFCKINNIEHLSLELLSLVEFKNSVLDISQLSTKHKRLKTYRGQFGLIEPLELFLGVDNFTIMFLFWKH